uniref:Uncharacterized protein n=1 Tax=Anguilla anguilla TaxID=7936 RepID=A0A0E9Q3S8_ANGAN
MEGILWWVGHIKLYWLLIEFQEIRVTMVGLVWWLCESDGEEFYICG